jgi:hypothetical protein
MVVDAGKNQDDSKPAEVDRDDRFWMIFFVGWKMMTPDENTNWAAAVGSYRGLDAENRITGWSLMLQTIRMTASQRKLIVRIGRRG